MTKTSLPSSKEDRARAYLQVLFEISARLQFIKSMESANLPYGISREVCHLQLRHICELIAIGCLVIQGDYTSSPDFSGEYNPQKVFRSLEKLYDGFFPQSATKVLKDGLLDIRVHPKSDAMTRKEMETLWGKTGNYLHRLKIYNFFRVEKTDDSNFWPEINALIAKLENLLNPHVVAMHNPKVLVIAGLDGNNGKPTLSFLEYGADQSARLSHFHGSGETPYWRA